MSINMVAPILDRSAISRYTICGQAPRTIQSMKIQQIGDPVCDAKIMVSAQQDPSSDRSDNTCVELALIDDVYG